MNSLLNIFLATKDDQYLKAFLVHANHVLDVRDDHSGRKDSFGRSLPGWQAGSHYTLGLPYVLRNEKNEPALLVQAVHKSKNNKMRINIEPSGESRFTLKIINSFRSKTLAHEFTDLTMENIERVVNKDLSPDKYIRVSVLSDLPPKAGNFRLSKTHKRVFTSAHTALIVLPLLRYAHLAKACNLPVRKSRRRFYLEQALESLQLVLSLWADEDGQSGHLIFDPSPTYWAAGLPVPYNMLSANGLAFLYAYLATNKAEFLDKARKLAQKVQRGISIADGQFSMPYWYGLPFTGWSSPDPSMAVDFYKKGAPMQRVEDVSHFVLTLWFMHEMNERGIFDFGHALSLLTGLFKKRLVKIDGANKKTLPRSWHEGKYFAKTLTGDGVGHDYAAAIFSVLGDQSILKDAAYIYTHRYSHLPASQKATFDVDYLSGLVLFGWSILARQGELAIRC